MFNSPPKYGKGLDWTGYTVHDAANILRRYLNQLPEPIIPLDFYDKFRDPIRSHQAQAVGDLDGQGSDNGDFDHDAAVATYQKLITELPGLNRQLLLYILDLLAVFASKSDLNRMNAGNLAAIFQPGIISHPNHDMAPSEYRLSQDVLIYLILNQDNFLIGMTGTAIDETTAKDVESGAAPGQTPKSNIGRSASSASAGADSLRKYGVRRNVSTSSRNSRGSSGVPSPGTPSSGIPLASGATGGGVARSNTVPSKKSPALASTRFQRPVDPSTPTSVGTKSSPTTGAPTSARDRSSTQVAALPRSPVSQQQHRSQINTTVTDSRVIEETTPSRVKSISTSIPPSPLSPSTSQPQSKERKISNLFSKSPLIAPTNISDPQLKEQKQPNRLKKKQRLPGSSNESAQSSQNSLHGEPTSAFPAPLASPDLATLARGDPMFNTNPILSKTAATPSSELPPATVQSAPGHVNDSQVPNSALKPPGSPEASIHSRSSVTDASDFDVIEDPAARAERADKRRHRWRFSSSAKKNGDSPLAPPPLVGQIPGARLSNSSLGSSNRPRKSFTGDSQVTQQLGTEASSTGYPSVVPQSSQDSSELVKENPSEPEKKGLFGKWKAKMSQSREEKKDREMEKERAKSPPRSDVERGGSRHSLSAFAQEHLPHRGRSIDKGRDEARPSVSEASTATPIAPSQSEPTPQSTEKTGS